jgi:hypothetical protein
VAIALLVFVVLAGVMGVLAWKAPISNSVTGAYVPPTSIGEIKPFSRARWFLHDAHAGQLAVDLAWFQYAKQSPARSVDDLDAAGFRPFVFVDEKGAAVEVAAGSPLQVSFGLGIISLAGTAGGYVSRRSMQDKNVLGKYWTESENLTIRVDPMADTSLYRQFLPDNPQFAGQYVCFLADVWDAAVARFVAIYHRPPNSFQDLLNGVGLKPNPKCVWPLDGGGGGFGCEGGIIDGKIAYWKVTLNGRTHGQARYYDTYNSSYDDPATPASITTSSGSSPVADPDQIQGQRVIMFSLSIIRDMLRSVRPSENSTQSQS